MDEQIEKNIMHPNFPLGVSDVFYPPESM